MLQHSCLGWSHVTSIFRRDRNLLPNNFYCSDIIFLCRDRDFCFMFIILSQHEFLCHNILLVNFLNFYRDNIFLCRDKVYLNLMLCLSRHKTSCLPLLALNVVSRHSFLLLRHKICLGLGICWNVCHNREFFRRHIVLTFLIVLLFSVPTKLSFVSTEFI